MLFFYNLMLTVLVFSFFHSNAMNILLVPGTISAKDQKRLKNRILFIKHAHELGSRYRISADVKSTNSAFKYTVVSNSVVSPSFGELIVSNAQKIKEVLDKNGVTIYEIPGWLDCLEKQLYKIN